MSLRLLMMTNENPYNPLQPTTDPTLFYGRKDAIAFFKQHLAGAVHQHGLVILGQRGIGKSSLLNQIALHIDERYVAVLIDIHLLSLEDEVGLVAALVDQIRIVMESIDASTYRLPEFPNPAEVDILRWFGDEFLAVALSAIRRERHLVILLDEIHLLMDAIDKGTFPAHFFTYLTELLDKHERLDIVVGLDITREEFAFKTAPLDNPNFHFRLTQLEPDEALLLVQEPVAEHYEYDHAALRKIQQLAGGNPFLLHSVCRLIHRLWEEKHFEFVTLGDVEAVYNAALDQASDIMNPLWEFARPNERLALTALLDLREHNEIKFFPLNALQDWLSKTEFPLNEVQLSAALRGLQYWGLVEVNEAGDYGFSSQLQGDWLLRHADLMPQEKPRASRNNNRPLPLRRIGISLGVLILVVGLLVVLTSGDDNPSDTPATSTLLVDPSPTNEPTTIPIFEFGG